jgi:ATP-dependent Clp protease ATP-binding subunit ClpX
VNPLREVITRDLVEYGLIPEFAGRFPVVAALDALTYEELVAIMRDAKDSLLQQKQAMLSVKNCTLEIDEQVLVLIARNALAQGTGARGVQAMLEKLLEPHIFDLQPNEHLHITQAGVNKERRGMFSEDDGDSPSSLAQASEPSLPRSPVEFTG